MQIAFVNNFNLYFHASFMTSNIIIILCYCYHIHPPVYILYFMNYFLFFFSIFSVPLYIFIYSNKDY